jgi:hypothetical protein
MSEGSPGDRSDCLRRRALKKEAENHVSNIAVARQWLQEGMKFLRDETENGAIARAELLGLNHRTVNTPVSFDDMWKCRFVMENGWAIPVEPERTGALFPNIIAGRYERASERFVPAFEVLLEKYGVSVDRKHRNGHASHLLGVARMQGPGTRNRGQQRFDTSFSTFHTRFRLALEARRMRLAKGSRFSGLNVSDCKAWKAEKRTAGTDERARELTEEVHKEKVAVGSAGIVSKKIGRLQTQQRELRDPMTPREVDRCNQTVFVERMRARLEERPLWGEKTPSYNGSVDPPYTVRGGGKSAEKFGTLVALRNAIAEDKVSELLEALDEWRFLKPGGSSSKARLLRISSVDPDHVFLLGGKNQEAYQAVKSSPMETELLDMANEIVGVLRESLVEEADSLGKREPILPEFDLIQILVSVPGGASYDLHNDLSKLLSNCNDRSRQTGLDFGVMEFLTVTLVLSSHDGMTSLVVQEARSRETLAEIPIGRNTIHLQLHGIQQFLHKVEVHTRALPPGVDDPGYRVVFSFRYTGPFQRTREERIQRLREAGIADLSYVRRDYRYVKALTKRPTGIQREDSVVGGKPAAENVRQHLDFNRKIGTIDLQRLPGRVGKHRWQSVPREEVAKGERQSTSVLVGNSFAPHVLFQSTLFMNEFMKRRMFVRVLDDKGACVSRVGPLFRNGTNPTDETILRPGELMAASEVNSMFNLPTSDHRHCTWGDHPHAVFMKLVLRNDTKGVPAEIRRVMENRRREGFWFGGVGGGGTVSGASGGFDFNSTEPLDETLAGHIPRPQDFTGKNGKMTDAFRKWRFLVAFIMLDKDEHEDAIAAAGLEHEDQVALYLGPYWIYEQKMLREEQSEVDTAMEELGLTDVERGYAAFREEAHVRWLVKPIPCASDPGFTFIDREGEPTDTSWRAVNVCLSDRRTIGVEVENDGIQEAVTRGVRLAHVAKNFFDKKHYNEFLAEDVDGVMPYEKEAPLKGGTKTAPEDMVVALMHVSGAGALRALKKNIDKKGRAGVLTIDQYMALGETLRTTALPMPIRTYDLTVLFLVGATGNEYRKRTRQYLSDPVNRTEVEDIYFGAMALRLTGRVLPFSEFCQWMRDTCHDARKGWFLPTRNDCEQLCEFIQLTGRRSGKVPRATDWTSKQCEASLPNDALSVVSLCRLLRLLRDSIPGLVEETLLTTEKEASGAGKEGDDPRSRAVEVTATLLHKLANDGWCYEKARFLAHLILADCEEVMQEPAGEVLVAVPGYGGTEGIKAVRNHFADLEKPPAWAERRKRTRGRKRKRTGVVGATDVLHDDDETTAKNTVIDLTTDEIRKQVDNKLLVMGLHRDEQNDVTVILTGRPLGLVDGEHGLCKNYGLLIQKHGSRMCTVSLFARPHLHPAPPAVSLDRDFGEAQAVLQKKAAAWVESVSGRKGKATKQCDTFEKLAPMPKVYWLRGESIPDVAGGPDEETQVAGRRKMLRRAIHVVSV